VVQTKRSLRLLLGTCRFHVGGHCSFLTEGAGTGLSFVRKKPGAPGLCLDSGLWVTQLSSPHPHYKTGKGKKIYMPAPAPGSQVPHIITKLMSLCHC
jgi:hypothetical protein